VGSKAATEGGEACATCCCCLERRPERSCILVALCAEGVNDGWSNGNGNAERSEWGSPLTPCPITSNFAEDDLMG